MSPASAPSDALEQVVIDTRPSATFAEGHIPGAAHFPCEGGECGLADRLSELPSPTRRVQLCARVMSSSASAAAEAVTLLLSAGFGAAISIGPPRPGANHALEKGPFSRRLWCPSPLCVCAMGLFENKPAAALDVGAGGGRDAAYLAAHGWQVTAVDRSSSLVSRAEKLAHRPYAGDVQPRGKVRGVIRTFGAHLREDREWLRQNAAQLVLVVRFLRRGVLELLPDAVLPGGVIAYEHFLIGCEKLGAPKKAAQMVQPGEIATVFSPERGFDVVQDVVETLDDGRPVNRFIAVRRRDEG